MKNIKIIKSTDKDYPKRLLKIKDYPQQLYVLGNYKLLNKLEIIAIVGSRNCTQYGRNQATSIANELSKNKICVISGMAQGIDTAAHMGAIKEKRKYYSSFRWRI